MARAVTGKRLSRRIFARNAKTGCETKIRTEPAWSVICVPENDSKSAYHNIAGLNEHAGAWINT